MVLGVRSVVAIVVGFMVSLSSSASVIVEQTQITAINDFGSGTGQSFVLEPGASVSDIQLHIGSASNGGGSVLVQLWRVQSGSATDLYKIDGNPIATGMLYRASVVGTPNWFTVALDRPYTNSSPDAVSLLFELELLTSGLGGWNNYSFSNQDPYQNGGLYHWDSSRRYFANSTSVSMDFAFRILGTPPEPPPAPPVVEIERIPATDYDPAFIEFFIRESVVGFTYTCYITDTLATPPDQWNISSTEFGNGGRLSWRFMIDSGPSTRFVQIRATENRAEAK